MKNLVILFVPNILPTNLELSQVQLQYYNTFNSRVGDKQDMHLQLYCQII